MKKIQIDPKRELIFDDKVVEQCKSCKRYGKKATCPPHIFPFEYYQRLLPTYKHCTIYYERFEIDDIKNWVRLGKKSSMKLTNFLLKKRADLFNKGHYFAVAFGGGSCKICKTCTFPCKFPDKALIPVEGTGLHIVEMMRLRGVEIKYPVVDRFYRVGCLFYD